MTVLVIERRSAFVVAYLLLLEGSIDESSLLNVVATKTSVPALTKKANIGSGSS